MNRRWSPVGSALSLAVLLCGEGCAHDAPPQPVRTLAAPPSPANATASAAVAPTVPGVHVELFVRSKDLRSIRQENDLAEIRSKLGPWLDLDLRYVVVEAQGALQSLQGPDELETDAIQSCARKYSDRWLDSIRCQNQSPADSAAAVHATSFAASWEPCARQLGISDTTIRTILHCAGSDEATTLLRQSLARAHELGVLGAPNLFIEGKADTGSRGIVALTRRICEASTQGRLDGCQNLPPLASVNVVLLEDQRAPDKPELESGLRQTIEKPLITHLDVSSEEGRKLFEMIEPTTLPAVVFDGTLAQDAEASKLYRGTLDLKSQRMVQSRGDWNPRCADEKGCQRPECRERPVCRVEVPASIDVFMMSRERFAAQGLPNLAATVSELERLGSPIRISVHLIGDIGPDGSLHSMHGQDEIDEDRRVACVARQYANANRFLDYLVCRAKDLKSSDWKSCLDGKTKMSSAVIQKCAEGPEGQRLVEASFRSSIAAKIGASPTWLVNDKFPFNGVDADLIKTKICEKNPKLKGCH